MVAHCHFPVVLEINRWQTWSWASLLLVEMLLSESLQLQGILFSCRWLPNCNGHRCKYLQNLQLQHPRVPFGIPVVLTGSCLCCFVVTWHSKHWLMISSIALFMAGNQYFSQSIFLVFVIHRCPRRCAALITFLCKLVGMMIWFIRNIRSSTKYNSCLAPQKCDVRVFFVLFSVTITNSGGHFMKLVILAGSFFDAVYSNSMFSIHNVLDDFLSSVFSCLW